MRRVGAATNQITVNTTIKRNHPGGAFGRTRRAVKHRTGAVINQITTNTIQRNYAGGAIVRTIRAVKLYACRTNQITVITTIQRNHTGGAIRGAKRAVMRRVGAATNQITVNTTIQRNQTGGAIRGAIRPVKHCTGAVISKIARNYGAVVQSNYAGIFKYRSVTRQIVNALEHAASNEITVSTTIQRNHTGGAIVRTIRAVKLRRF